MDLGGAHQNRGRYGKTKRLGGPDINPHLELYCWLHWQVGWPFRRATMACRSMSGRRGG